MPLPTPIPVQIWASLDEQELIQLLSLAIKKEGGRIQSLRLTTHWGVEEWNLLAEVPSTLANGLEQLAPRWGYRIARRIK